MKVIIKAKNIKLNPALKEHIQEKINSVERFLKAFQDEECSKRFLGKGKPKIEAWVEIGRETLHHQKGPFFRAECQIKFPKQNIRVVARSGSLRVAIVEVRNELKRELKQYKEKIITKRKRRQRVLKKELKISPSARFYRKGRIREEGI